MSDLSMTVVSQDDELLTVQQVADWLKVEPRYVYRLASSGFLLRVYVGRYVRIPAASVRAYIQGQHGRGDQSAASGSSSSSSWCSCSSAAAERWLMANSKGRRRRFGSIRRLPSGRYQARYPGPDGVDRPADDTFATKADAEDWLTLKEAEILEDDWIDPDAGNVFVPAYVETWIGENTALRPKTVKIYRGLLRSHIAPHLATVTVGEMTLARVRRWRKKLLDSGVSAITVAKAYRLLRAVFNTAVDDEMIKRNPCRIKGAGNEDSPERPVLTVAAGLRPGRCCRAPLSGPDPARRVHQPALGRTRRTHPGRHRPGRAHRPGNPSALLPRKGVQVRAA